MFFRSITFVCVNVDRAYFFALSPIVWGAEAVEAVEPVGEIGTGDACGDVVSTFSISILPHWSNGLLKY